MMFLSNKFPSFSWLGNWVVGVGRGTSSRNIRKKPKHQEFKNNHYVMSCGEYYREKGLVSHLKEVGI